MDELGTAESLTLSRCDTVNDMANNCITQDKPSEQTVGTDLSGEHQKKHQRKSRLMLRLAAEGHGTPRLRPRAWALLGGRAGRRADVDGVSGRADKKPEGLMD